MSRMLGPRFLVLLMAISIITGVCMLYVPGCQPPDVANCTWNNDESNYDCSGGNK